MPKIEPLNGSFENLQAMLAHIAEDENAAGFVGCILMKDGTMKSVHFCATRQHMSFAAAMLLSECTEQE